MDENGNKPFFYIWAVTFFISCCYTITLMKQRSDALCLCPHKQKYVSTWQKKITETYEGITTSVCLWHQLASVALTQTNQTSLVKYHMHESRVKIVFSQTLCK